MRWILISIISLLLASGCVLGNREGTISGTVVNSAGEPISEVNLAITSVNVSGTSDSNGNFTLNGLKTGSYDVDMKKTGYANTTVKYVELADPGSVNCATPSNKVTLTLPLFFTNISGLIYDVATSDSSSGYDFTETSTTTATTTTTDDRILSSTSPRCDIYFSYDTSSGKKLLISKYPSGGIKDMDSQTSLDKVGSAPISGYSINAEVITGHCYVIKTIEGYYAKLWAVTVSNTNLYFLWALQPVSGNNQF